ncbi:carbohydrate esterase family 16 protein [Peniophora sp. CONT]|nr:carbohydrate esterase family 16 protein [Peniophora sp. CONT]
MSSVDMLLAYPRETWAGKNSLERIVVFGDSYSSDLTTWVGYLTKSGYLVDKPYIQNFAFDGASAEDDLSGQVAAFFAESDAFTSEASQTTYFFFLGINDCGQTDTDDLDSMVEILLDAAHELYVKAKARNFVFLNVPPTDRSPGAIAIESEQTMIDRTTTWNDSLRERVAEFADETPRASVFLFSVHAVLCAVLDKPEVYGFMADDIAREDGAIWEDELHLTTEVHAIIAKGLVGALFSDSRSE